MNTDKEEKDLTTEKILLEIERNIHGLFKKYLQSTPLSVFVLDWSLKIIYMNPAFERLTGFQKEDMATGRAKFCVHPKDREETESSLTMAIVGRTAKCRCRIRGTDRSFHALALSFSPLQCDERCLVLCVEFGPPTK